MAQTFHKQSIGFNPLLSTRDWTVWGCILAGCLVAGLLLNRWMPNEMVRNILIGSVIGQLPSLLTCLPVRGTVNAAGETAFMGRMQQFGFIPSGETDEGRIFNHKGPRWLRWDSNRNRDSAPPATSCTSPRRCTSTGSSSACRHKRLLSLLAQAEWIVDAMRPVR